MAELLWNWSCTFQIQYALIYRGTPRMYPLWPQIGAVMKPRADYSVKLVSWLALLLFMSTLPWTFQESIKAKVHCVSLGISLHTLSIPSEGVVFEQFESHLPDLHQVVLVQAFDLVGGQAESLVATPSEGYIV